MWRTIGAWLMGLFVVGAQWVQGAEPNSAEPAAIRVMSFNVRFGTADDGADHWKHRRDLLVDTITHFDPDLLGTQELLAMQGDYLAAHLQGYQQVGVGRDDGKRKGEFSAIFVRTARFKVLESGTFWLSKTPEVVASKDWDAAITRIATWARLEDQQTQRVLLMLNTHWDHQGKVARFESAKVIRHWLEEHAGSEPLIVCGDLNSFEVTDAYRELVGAESKLPLHDSYRVLFPERDQQHESSFHGFKGKQRGQRIDYIFYSAGLVPLEAAINHTEREGHFPSDHFPVTAALKLQ